MTAEVTLDERDEDDNITGIAASIQCNHKSDEIGVQIASDVPTDCKSTEW